MLKFFITPAAKYAYLRTFKRTKFIVWPTPEGMEFVKDMNIGKFFEIFTL